MDTARKSFGMSVAESLDPSRSAVLEQSLWIVFFAALTAVGAQIQIPHQPVPYTLQTFFVLLSAAFLGGRNGSISQAVYLAAGLIGIPVFSGSSFGVAVLTGPTAGYLIGFPVAAMVIGYMIRHGRSYPWILFSMIAGLFIIFSMGTVVLYFWMARNTAEAFVNGFLIFSWWDAVKLLAAAAIYYEFAKKFRTLPG
jgi:biotin transport system substrate-specific component